MCEYVLLVVGFLMLCFDVDIDIAKILVMDCSTPEKKKWQMMRQSVILFQGSLGF